MSKIYNPSTRRMVLDNPRRRREIKKYLDLDKTVDWDTAVAPILIATRKEDISNKNLDIILQRQQQQRKKEITQRAAAKPLLALENLDFLKSTLETQLKRGVLRKYKYVYTVRFYRKGDLTTKKGAMRDGAVLFEDTSYATVNKDEKIIVASRVRLQTRMYLEEKNGEMTDAILATGNEQFMAYFQNLTVSDDSIVGMTVAKEQPITELRNLRQTTDKILYQTENVAISDKNNYFELDIDRKNKTFVSNAIIGGLPYACMYNVCMKLGEKINERYKTAEYKVSMESIANDCKVTERFLSGDYGLTINEALLWFQRYNISFSCYDIFWRQVFHWENNGKENKHKIRACSVLIHNAHAYYLSDNAKRSLTQKQELTIQELPKPSDNYIIKGETKQEKEKPETKKKEEVKRKDVFKKCNTIDLVFEAIFALDADENLTIYCITENLMDIVRKMIFCYGITPQVNGKLGQVKSIDLVLTNNLIKIYTIHNQMIKPEVLEKLTIEEYMLYCNERDTLSKVIINNKYKSTYNENVKRAFKYYSRGSLKGLCKGVQPVDEELYGLDACKSYPSILNNYIEFLPIYSSFDDFTEYKGDMINPYHFYIVQKVDEFVGSECIFDANEIMTSGNTVLYLQDKLKVNIQIVAELKACRLVKNPLYGKLKEIFEKNDYDVSLKKFLVLSIIGLLGRRQNSYKKMILSTDEEYIQSICQQYGELGVSTYPMKIDNTDEILDEEDELPPPLYAFYNEQKTTLSSGFYPIQLLIYDLQRVTTYRSYKTVSMFTTPLAINTDCVYFRKCEALENYIKNTFDGSFGSKKLEKPKDVYSYSCVDAVGKKRESIGRSLIKEYKQNVISIKNEYDLKEIASKLENWTLITADIAGSGKSYCLQNILDKSKTLYVTPYNKLAFILRQKGYQATTFAKLTGYKIEGIINVERKPYDLTGIENIVFEEIYSYELSYLQLLNKFTSKNKMIHFFGTGDTFQLEGVNTNVSFDYIDMSIRKMFKNNIHFKIHKRDAKAHDFLVTLKEALFTPNVDLVQLLRKFFKVVPRSFASEKAVCYYNDTCEIVNDSIMKKQRGNNNLLIGDELLCRSRLTTKVGDMIPNYIYRVVAITDDLITLFEPFEEINFVVKQHTVYNHFRFQYSETAHSVQGATFDEKITVFDINYSNWALSPRWAYVALTRSSNIFENITICVEDIHNNIIMNLDEKIKAYEISDKAKGFEFNERLYPRLNKYSFKKMFQQQNGCCAICGCAVKLNWSFSQDTQQYSIDRIDNDFVGGHCIDNLQIVCLGDNHSKK